MNKLLKFIFLISTTFAISGCSNNISNDAPLLNNDGTLGDTSDVVFGDGVSPTGEYVKNELLVKCSSECLIETNINDLKKNYGLKSYEPTFPNSNWYKLFFDNDVSSIITSLRTNYSFEKVDYDYLMTNSDTDSIEVTNNPLAADQSYLETMGIIEGWDKHDDLDNRIGGGSNDIIVAVIDSGVDYTHMDLRNNIWTNSGEIPNNGIDDDNNGYVDDVNGWNCVDNNNNPMDDNGHGTHVAGIIASENNNIGSVGVAYNCKIMPIKAAAANGSLSNANIAEAITYAYMNGASVINMSFGGTSMSLATQEALENAYSYCALIAAAGNESSCTNPNCTTCIQGFNLKKSPSYPACLPFVVGVMSCDNNATKVSSFSNFDHEPYHFNEFEYDCFAVGEEIVSTWPNNRYAKLNGTSMSAPIISGMAAILRSKYQNRDLYPTKYLHSQITNSGIIKPQLKVGLKEYENTIYSLSNLGRALTVQSKPNISNVYDYLALDSTSFSSSNNGDGVINSGETIKLGVTLSNKGGKASNVHISLDASDDPYVDIISSYVELSDIGTYSTNGYSKIYEDSRVVDIENAFTIKINDNCPNNYSPNFILNYTYTNGLDIADTTLYSGTSSLKLEVQNGVLLSGIIDSDTTFTSSTSYIIASTLLISKNATVTFEPGCVIKFYANSIGDINTQGSIPTIQVYGSLIFNGSSDNMISLKTNDGFRKCYNIRSMDKDSIVIFRYCNITNCNILNTYVTFSFKDHGTFTSHCNIGFENLEFGGATPRLDINEADSCYFNLTVSNLYLYFNKLTNSYIYMNPDFSIYTYFMTWSCTNESPYRIDRNFICENNLFVFTKKTGSSKLYFETRIVDMSVDYAEMGNFTNNRFVCLGEIRSVDQSPNFEFNETSGGSGFAKESTQIYGNVFEPKALYDAYLLDKMSGVVDSKGNMQINVYDIDNFECEYLWPYIKNISLIDKNGNYVNEVGNEECTVEVEFSCDIDTSLEFSLYYGSSAPYKDYRISGEFTSNRIWRGNFRPNVIVSGGINYFSINGGYKLGDQFKKVVDLGLNFPFNIDSSSSMSMSLVAVNTPSGISLSWFQDDYDTLMGYNVYRSEEKDSYYTRINASVIPSIENTFLDEDAMPGETYWYTFTVVLSDMSESQPAGKVSCTAYDSIEPNLYHTPINQGYLNNNLVITCTATDNIGVKFANLYYRTKGTATWNKISMSKQNDRYSAIIYGSELSMLGLEYYIEVNDGTNTVYKGTEDNPYQVVIKDSSAISKLGDVDGDGAITTKDALMIMKSINGDIILTHDEFVRADLNKDNVLSSFEALRILQYINGNVGTLEM